jgi:hypothetical protein
MLRATALIERVVKLTISFLHRQFFFLPGWRDFWQAF